MLVSGVGDAASYKVTASVFLIVVPSHFACPLVRVFISWAVALEFLVVVRRIFVPCIPRFQNGYYTGKITMLSRIIF